MEYRGIEYAIVQGSQPEVWKWSVMVGDPEMLRIGDASSEQRAEMQVRSIIDRALAIEKPPPARISTAASKLTGNL
jgi:hypothetical protein